MMIPITRIERYINEIVGNGDTAPDQPITREEIFYAAILGEVPTIPTPITNEEKYLSAIANNYIDELPQPVTRIEKFLARAAGMDVTIPIPITREEMFWTDYALIVEKEISGVPPLTFNAIAGTLKNYRIYGNTVNGESVGDRTGNLFDGNFLQGYWATANGAFVSANNWVCSSKLPCAPNTTYTSKFSTLSRWYGYIWFDIDGNFIGSTLSQESATPTSPIIFTVTSPSNAAYFGFDIAGAAWNTLIHPEDVTDLMIVEGSTALPYEPYGKYKIPVTLTADSAETTDIYLDEPLAKSGNNADYIDYATQKRYNSDGTESSVTLPEISTFAGTNVLSVGTEVQPSNVYIKYEGAR